MLSEKTYTMAESAFLSHRKVTDINRYIDDGVFKAVRPHAGNQKIPSRLRLLSTKALRYVVLISDWENELSKAGKKYLYKQVEKLPSPPKSCNCRTALTI